MIAKCPKPPKDNEKRRKQVRFNEKCNRACNNSEDNDDHNNHSAEKCFKRIRKEKEKARAVDVSSNSNLGRPPRKCLYVDLKIT